MTYQNPSLLFSEGIPSGRIGWQSPSNIALVKYWGKKSTQIPCNPSLSFTLDRSCTTTRVHYQPASSAEWKVKFFLNGKLQTEFGEKTKTFFESVAAIFPFIKQLDFEIYSENSFPHSAGIASSASGMSALALVLCDLERQYFGSLHTDTQFYQKASYVARLGSGSASRSVYGGLALWGKTAAVADASDLYAIPVGEKVDPVFSTYQDTVLLVNAEQKKVSSRVGHSLMKNNPYASVRFEQAYQHVEQLLAVMAAGDLETFIQITESEALSLHAMMMTSMPYYLLLKANTLQIIERLFAFRDESHLPVSFTLDAGPNIHLLYPQSVKAKVIPWVKEELRQFLSPLGFIDDHVGDGPVKLDGDGK
jgi:diphosphomevalonate decarboxylase